MTDKSQNENFVRYLDKGEFFGEKGMLRFCLSILSDIDLFCFHISKALQKEDENTIRTANVVAESDVVVCLAIDRK